MGKRGPRPKAGVTFRGRPVVLLGGLPSIRWPDHPLARSGGLVLIHRLVAGEARGRLLTRGERVRWRDGDVWNWHPSNLEITSQAAPLLACPARSRQRSAKRRWLGPS